MLTVNPNEPYMILQESYIPITLALSFFCVCMDGFRHKDRPASPIAWFSLQHPTELWKKKRFNLQAPPVYDRKVTNLFFPIIIFFPYFLP